MIRSMTGFARRERQFPWGLHRVGTQDRQSPLPRNRLPAAGGIPRGGVRLSPDHRRCSTSRQGGLSLHFRPATASTTLEVDAELLASLTQRAQQAALQAGAAARIEVTDLLRWPGVVREPPKDSAPLIGAAHALLGEALAELTRFRDSEGGRLKRGAGAALCGAHRFRLASRRAIAGGARAHPDQIAGAHRATVLGCRP